jgi:hypothetical protein
MRRPVFAEHGRRGVGQFERLVEIQFRVHRHSGAGFSWGRYGSQGWQVSHDARSGDDAFEMLRN